MKKHKPRNEAALKRKGEKRLRRAKTRTRRLQSMRLETQSKVRKAIKAMREAKKDDAVHAE